MNGLLLSALPFPQIDPVMLQIGPLAIHWYGMAYVVGILFGLWYAKWLVASPGLWADNKPPLTARDLDDLLIWMALGIVLGGRVGYVLFYDFSRFLQSPAEIFAIWNGGMSFHGGVVGSLIVMILFARRRSISVFSLFDLITVASCMGLLFGRLANFINAELWGRVTDVSWAFVFPNAGPLPRHPSQLYEAALEGLLLFIILNVLIFGWRRLKLPGFIAGCWIALYGLARILVEFFREPDAHLGYLAGGWLTMGMILSLPMILIGLWSIQRSRRHVAKA
ncbi:MAG: prolipoprotein diacylglyceryl transferase [Pseudomonadota bacterium]